MKDYKKAKRRKISETKFRRRVRIWTQFSWVYSSTSKEQYIKDVYSGKDCTFLRTTLNPCNCWMCSGDNKYVRQQKQYWLKDQKDK